MFLKRINIAYILFLLLIVTFGSCLENVDYTICTEEEKRGILFSLVVADQPSQLSESVIQNAKNLAILQYMNCIEKDKEKKRNTLFK